MPSVVYKICLLILAGFCSIKVSISIQPIQADVRNDTVPVCSYLLQYPYQTIDPLIISWILIEYSCSYYFIFFHLKAHVFLHCSLSRPVLDEDIVVKSGHHTVKD